MTYQLSIEEMDRALVLVDSFVQVTPDAEDCSGLSALPASPQEVEVACIIFLRFADTPGFRDHVATTNPRLTYLFEPTVRNLLKASLVLNLPRFIPDDDVEAYNRAFTDFRQKGRTSGVLSEAFMHLHSHITQESKRIQDRLAGLGLWP